MSNGIIPCSQETCLIPLVNNVFWLLCFVLGGFFVSFFCPPTTISENWFLQNLVIWYCFLVIVWLWHRWPVLTVVGCERGLRWLRTCCVLWYCREEAQLCRNRSFHLHLSMTSAPSYMHPAVGARVLYGRVRNLISSLMHTSMGLYHKQRGTWTSRVLFKFNTPFYLN